MENLLKRSKEFYMGQRIKMNIFAAVLDVLLFVYFIPLFVSLVPSESVFAWSEANEHLWYSVYNCVSPFTIGKYILGATLLWHFLIYENKILNAVISAFYIWVLFNSLIVTMGMTHAWELYIYIPDIVVIVLAGVILYKKTANRRWSVYE